MKVRSVAIKSCYKGTTVLTWAASPYGDLFYYTKTIIKEEKTERVVCVHQI